MSYPSGVGVINVKSAPFLAAGNGTTDDTAAIQAAIKEALHSEGTLYFPNGTYLVSNTLEWRNASNSWDTYLSMQGQSQAGTIIKLANNIPAFGSSTTPKAVIMTASQNPNSAVGTGNQAFQNNIRNLTIDVGSGNPGAIGIDYIVSNAGEIRDVTIKSTDATKRGKAGLWLKRGESGPGYVRNVTIEGFDVGVEADTYQYGFTLEYLTLRHQLVAGIRNEEHPLTIRKLTSVNTVPAVLANLKSDGLINLIDANCTGGSSSNQAVNFKGGMVIRNLSTSGYGAAIRNSNTNVSVSGPNVAEYFSHGPVSEFSSASSTLDLPIEDAPVYQNDDLNDWVVVDDSAADDTVAIRNAISTANSQGKKTIAFKAGKTYVVSDTIVVSGGVQRILGNQASLELASALRNGDTRSIFRVENLSGSVLIFERFAFRPSKKDFNIQTTWLEQNTTKPLVMRDLLSFGGLAYKNTVTGGKLFVENVAASGWRFNNQRVWARQFNPEFHYAPYVRNEGASGFLVVLGLKTEGKGALIETRNGAWTEVLGGCVIAIDNPNSPVVYPFIINQANAFLSWTNTNNNLFANQVQEIRSAVTQVRQPAENTGFPARVTCRWLMPGLPPSL
ncbi:MAG: hypothetical protein HC904_08880 [Blastochloris sp.]|nr:hypothetical protein [Blastochloris sp.]